MDSFENFSELLTGWFEVHDVPDHLQRKLYEKIKNDIFDAGESFSLATLAEDDDEDEEENKEEKGAETFVLVSTRDLSAKEDIWLVDHCCTFTLREFRSHLESNETLRIRLGNILSLKLSFTDAKKDTQTIFDSMWNKVDAYRLPISSQNTNDAQYESYWFIHDEVGSAITVVINETGNMKLEPIPICFPEKGGVFSAMWCVKDIEEGSITTRTATSVLQAVGGKDVVRLLYSSKGEEEKEGNYENAYIKAERSCVESWKKFVDKMESVSVSNNNNNTALGQSDFPREIDMENVKLPLRVFTDSKLVSEYLTDSQHFILVDLPQEAHIIWISHDPIEDLNQFKYALFISQFPEEQFFTSKQGLLHLIQENFGFVDWYQVSYDSTSQLREFIGDFIVREHSLEEGLNNNDNDNNIVSKEYISHLRNNDGTNLWLTKPSNLARSIDMTVSSNLKALLKAIETGPKVICKYIANTSTLRGRKLDLRFIVAVRSFANMDQTPMEAYVYNVFWTRFALEQYTLDEFDKYEKHWTVMNYANPDKLLQLHDCDFIKEFNAEYANKGYGPSVWSEIVYPKILKMLYNIFSIIKVEGNSRTRCRAIYGVDVMLREVICENSKKQTLEPSLLEITYSPDCYRACKYHPEFFNDVFRTLFLGKPTGMKRL